MSTNPNTPNNSEEVDLGQLFKLIGAAFDRFFNFIYRIFKGLFSVFIWFVFFIKKCGLAFSRLVFEDGLNKAF